MFTKNHPCRLIDTGGCEGINIFDLAWKNELSPYQYGFSKAYEMISCFEGIVAYGPITLAADAALGRDPALPVDIVGENDELSYTSVTPTPLSECETPMLQLDFASPSEGKIPLIDYASAGRAWNRTIAAWLPIL